MSAHHEDARPAAFLGLDETLAQLGERRMTERRQRRVERQHYGQVEIVAALCQRLDLQAGTIERGKRHGAVLCGAAGGLVTMAHCTWRNSAVPSALHSTTPSR